MNRQPSGKPLEELQQEHRHLDKILNVMSEMAERVDRGGDVGVSALLRTVLFLRFFAQQCHQQKEEQWLFPAVRARGGKVGGELVAALLEDHRKIEAALQRLAEASSTCDCEDNAARERLREALAAVTNLYRDHIWKEDHFLLPIAWKLITPVELVALRDGFGAVEAEIGSDLHHHFEEFADELDEALAAGR